MHVILTGSECFFRAINLLLKVLRENIKGRRAGILMPMLNKYYVNPDIVFRVYTCCSRLFNCDNTNFCENPEENRFYKYE